MKIYVAGKTEDIPTVRQVQGLVRHTGHHISYDWTEDVERYGPGMPRNPEIRQTCAEKDVTGIWVADLVVVLGHPRLNGGLWECGMTVAWRKPLWLVRWELCSGHSIFENLPNVRLMDIQRLGEELWHISEKRLEQQAAVARIVPPPVTPITDV